MYTFEQVKQTFVVAQNVKSWAQIERKARILVFSSFTVKTKTKKSCFSLFTCAYKFLKDYRSVVF